MEISHYNYVYAVVHDLSTVRSNDFIKVEYDEVSLINTAGNRLIPRDMYGVFKDERGNIFLGITDIFKTYNMILTYQEKEYYINYVHYEEVSHLLEWEPHTVNGFFKLMDSKPAGRLNSDRCDAARNGPSVFIREGQVPIGTAVNSLRPMSLSDLEVYFSLLSVDGVAHLIYVKYFEGQNDSNEEFETNESDLPTASRSIFPLLKLLLEWESMTYDPWNSTEEVAVACKIFFEKLGITEQIRDEINSNNGPMHVYRYLRGDIDARMQPAVSELGAMTSLTKIWLKTKMLYPNIKTFYRGISN